MEVMRGEEVRLMLVKLTDERINDDDVDRTRGDEENVRCPIEQEFIANDPDAMWIRVNLIASFPDD